MGRCNPQSFLGCLLRVICRIFPYNHSILGKTVFLTFLSSLINSQFFAFDHERTANCCETDCLTNRLYYHFDLGDLRYHEKSRCPTNAEFEYNRRNLLLFLQSLPYTIVLKFEQKHCILAMFLTTDNGNRLSFIQICSCCIYFK